MKMVPRERETKRLLFLLLPSHLSFDCFAVGTRTGHHHHYSFNRHTVFHFRASRNPEASTLFFRCIRATPTMNQHKNTRLQYLLIPHLSLTTKRAQNAPKYRHTQPARNSTLIMPIQPQIPLPDPKKKSTSRLRNQTTPHRLSVKNFRR